MKQIAKMQKVVLCLLLSSLLVLGIWAAENPVKGKLEVCTGFEIMISHSTLLTKPTEKAWLAPRDADSKRHVTLSILHQDKLVKNAIN